MKPTPFFRMPTRDNCSKEQSKNSRSSSKPSIECNTNRTNDHFLVQFDNRLHVGISLLENWLGFNFRFHDTNHVCLVLALISEIATIMFHRYAINIY